MTAGLWSTAGHAHGLCPHIGPRCLWRHPSPSFAPCSPTPSPSSHAASTRGGPLAATKRRKEVVVGIDLGTTNSAVAYIEGGKPKCIPNQAGDKVTPSVVCFTPEGDAVVGKAARRLAASQPDNTFYSVKRVIGRAFDDPVVTDEAKRLAYKVSKDESGQVTLVCPTVDRGFVYPEEVSAQVLAQLLDDAEVYTGGEVRKAVISVPAYFNDKQREATANAGKLAGLDVVRIIREPVAAALAYGLNLKEDQTVLVFDLGGGTYDISLLEVGNGTIEVLSTGGDPHLGGDDWDQLVVEWLTHTHLSRARPRIDPSQDPRLRANMRALAEAAKIGLTENEVVALRMPVGGPKGGPLEVQLSRTQFEELSEPLFRRARLPLDQACWVAGVDLNALVSEVDKKRETLSQRGVPTWRLETMRPEIRPKARAPLSKVLLVGGASRMPAVTSFIRNMTGLEPEPDIVNPDEAVALGAAVQAGILQGQLKELMVMDQWQASLMRAVAKLQLREDKVTRASVEDQFDMADDPESSMSGSMSSGEGLTEDERAEERAILAALDADSDTDTQTTNTATTNTAAGTSTRSSVAPGAATQASTSAPGSSVSQSQPQTVSSGRGITTSGGDDEGVSSDQSEGGVTRKRRLGGGRQRRVAGTGSQGVARGGLRRKRTSDVTQLGDDEE